MVIITILGDIVWPPWNKDSRSSQHQAVKNDKKPLPCTQEKTPSTGRGSKRPASFELTAFSKSNSVELLTYSVLRLRSQLTRPTPMLPNKIAPGAGIWP